MATPAELGEIAAANFEELKANEYPGRGIVLGRTAVGDAVQVYWVMGRSENSRNRLLVEEDDVVKTVPFDESKVEDPSLIIYNAMRVLHRSEHGAYHIVSNGDQTDTVYDFLAKGQSAQEAVETRTYEPDAPNYTPRITGLTAAFDNSNQDNDTTFWITLRGRLDPHTIQKRFRVNLRDEADNGIGHCLHTYEGNGDPLPAFRHAPYPVPVGEGAKDTAEMFWDALNREHRVALATKVIDRQSGDITYSIINQHEQ